MPTPDEELQRQLQAAAASLTPEQMRELIRSFARPNATARHSHRKPRRTEPALYRIRVDLDDAHPPIWRRIDIRSDLTLADVHQILQAAFAWWDYHLYRFSLGGGPWDRTSELFLCPYDVQEGEDLGTPASEVRLDEALREPGDRLQYVYDYGDSWELTLRLEKVLPDNGTRAQCVDGRRAAPPEDCGGTRDADDLAEVLPDPAHFDPNEVNEALQASEFVLAEAGVDKRLVDLVHRLSVEDPEFAQLMGTLASPAPQPSPAAIADALRPFQWFLDRAVDGGIPLTAAGYLKPADVEAAAALLPTVKEWMGKNNREVNVGPLIHFRESLQTLGLLRKYKGALLLTKIGKQAQQDPEKLLRHIASRLIPDKEGFDQLATVLILGFAATTGETPYERVANLMSHLGWGRADGRPLDRWSVYHLPVMTTLRNVPGVTSHLARAAITVR